MLLAGGGIFTWLRLAPPSWLHASARTSPSAAPTPKVKLTTTPVSPVTSNGPPADPFSGSPSDAWADGTAGIAIPAAKAHGRYTAAQVRSAYEKTSKLLAAGNLNWPTLRGGAPTAFADLLTKPERKDFLAGLHATGPQQGRKREEHPDVGRLVRPRQHAVRHHRDQGARQDERRHRD